MFFLCNMRTLSFMTPEKQKEKAQETLDIYAPLADRLGISKIKTELEDLCLRYLDKDAYFDLADKIHRKQSEREADVEKIVKEIRQKCEEADIKCTVYGRPKHFFGTDMGKWCAQRKKLLSGGLSQANIQNSPEM